MIKVFEKLIIDKQNEINDLKKDKDKNSVEIKQLTFKVINFRKALTAIKSYPDEITKGEDIKHIKGIGKGIISRIDEILKEGTSIGEIKQGMSVDYSNQEDLQQITGVGHFASELFKKGITLNKLMLEMNKIKNNFNQIEEDNILNNLTHHQLLGVKYYEDISIKIPRAEIRSIQLKLKDLLIS